MTIIRIRQNRTIFVRTIDILAYSVDPRYIGRTVGIELTDDEQHIQIYYNGELIRAHDITTHQFNYNPDDRVEILGSDLLKGRSTEDIKAYIEEHLSDYDQV